MGLFGYLSNDSDNGNNQFWSDFSIVFAYVHGQESLFVIYDRSEWNYNAWRFTGLSTKLFHNIIIYDKNYSNYTGFIAVNIDIYYKLFVDLVGQFMNNFWSGVNKIDDSSNKNTPNVNEFIGFSIKLLYNNIIFITIKRNINVFFGLGTNTWCKSFVDLA